ncbi:hypothetical protein EW145_g4110 [Phellinidium pouzarii]|uniref:Ricin B lectin domain-containing protein n=1 Tax=Phellinidium pouzarii TaxID=167371 RepID=A0A4S4L586_9AGAM|nr:hypothetical protein EW145_g4110 [Phellinidium pouzarii]
MSVSPEIAAMCIEPGMYKLINVLGNVALDLSGGDGKSIIAFTTHGQGNQQWIISSPDQQGNQTIKGASSGKYLAIEGLPQNSERLVASQDPVLWAVRRDGGDRSVWRVYWPGTGFNFDLSDRGNSTPGTPIQLWEATEGKNQMWKFEAAKKRVSKEVPTLFLSAQKPKTLLNRIYDPFAFCAQRIYRFIDSTSAREMASMKTAYQPLPLAEMDFSTQKEPLDTSGCEPGSACQYHGSCHKNRRRRLFHLAALSFLLLGVLSIASSFVDWESILGLATDVGGGFLGARDTTSGTNDSPFSNEFNKLKIYSLNRNYSVLDCRDQVRSKTLYVVLAISVLAAAVSPVSSVLAAGYAQRVSLK